jgi:SPP1 gp7 family putative phage head morphogenesis protein
MRKLFADQQREVLANLAELAPQIESQFAGWHKRKIARYIQKNPKLVAGILFDEKEQIKVFEKAGKPLISSAFEDAGNEMFSDLDIEFDFDLHNTRADKFIKGRAGKYAGQVVGTTYKTLRETLLEGFREGETVSQIANRIRHEFDIADRHRAMVIARTEVIGASNAGSLEGMRQSGVVKEKEWITSQDDRVRDSHTTMDEQVVGINEVFTSGDGNTAQYPGGFGVAAEDIQERCTTAPVVET